MSEWAFILKMKNITRSLSMTYGGKKTNRNYS